MPSESPSAVRICGHNNPSDAVRVCSTPRCKPRSEREHGLFAEGGAVAAPLDRVAHTVGCTNTTRLGGRRELMSCGSGDASVEDTGGPPTINAVTRRRAEAGSRAPWRHAQRGRSAAETLDAAEHGGMLALLSEAGHHRQRQQSRHSR